MNGIDVLTSLALEKIRPRVILWSNSLELINRKMAMQLGADLVCRKPSNALELKAIFNQLSWPVAVSPPVQPRPVSGLITLRNGRQEAEMRAGIERTGICDRR